MVKIVFFLCLFFLSSDMAGADQDIEKREEPSRSEGFEKRREPSQTESEKASLFKSEKQRSQSGEQSGKAGDFARDGSKLMLPPFGPKPQPLKGSLSEISPVRKKR